ncbi:50S ribosomal protein L24 [bacterium]|nr:MAG: 50S ribosomal protein L24 [bacterium]
MAARIRKGDEVVVISGSDKGKKGKILAIFAEDGKVVVEGVNVKKRHRKATQQSEGAIISKEAPLHACKVMPVDPKTGKGTRVSFKSENGKAVKDAKGQPIRLAKSGETIPYAARETAVAAKEA